MHSTFLSICSEFTIFLHAKKFNEKAARVMSQVFQLILQPICTGGLRRLAQRKCQQNAAHGTELSYEPVQRTTNEYVWV